VTTYPRAIEESAWDAYCTEFFATYDYKSIWEASRAPPGSERRRSAGPARP